jgi:hypothetical protein
MKSSEPGSNPQPFDFRDPQAWRAFLERYSRELLATDGLGGKITAKARSSGWMGYPPASPDAIATAERCLGRRLPPSLRTFYSVTNGWRSTGHFIWDILPVRSIDWLEDRDPDLYQLAVDAEEEEGPFQQDPGGARLREYQYEQGTRVKRALIINSLGDAANWLLDPGEADDGGEWPGGRWASWNPGMDWTAQSFGELMVNEFQSFISIRDNREPT